MEGGAPCGACKFLRRKCVKGCVFSPYFSTEEFGAAHFGAIHKIFGASNFSKLLQRIPSEEERYDAVVSISYEAQARLHDPIYGCVSHIFALQHQVAHLQAQLSFANERLARYPGKITLNTQSHNLSQKEGEIASASSITSPPNDPQFSYPNAGNKIPFYPNITKDCNSCVPMNVDSSEEFPSASQQMDAFEEDRNSTEVSPEQGGDLHALAFSFLKRSRR
ncbi:hypothetical protein SUGI_0859180 [Cryptomeria japonica]|nr:hypothetical protein SUGI_0859180 [Cryptomeria japonica]